MSNCAGCRCTSSSAVGQPVLDEGEDVEDLVLAGFQRRPSWPGRIVDPLGLFSACRSAPSMADPARSRCRRSGPSPCPAPSPAGRRRRTARNDVGELAVRVLRALRALAATPTPSVRAGAGPQRTWPSGQQPRRGARSCSSPAGRQEGRHRHAHDARDAARLESDELREAVAAKAPAALPPRRLRGVRRQGRPGGVRRRCSAVAARLASTPQRSRTSTASTTTRCARACSPACASIPLQVGSISATSATCSRWPRSPRRRRGVRPQSPTASRRPRPPRLAPHRCTWRRPLTDVAKELKRPDLAPGLLEQTPAITCGAAASLLTAILGSTGLLGAASFVAYAVAVFKPLRMGSYVPARDLEYDVGACCAWAALAGLCRR